MPPPDSDSTGYELIGWDSEEAAGIEATVLTKESIEIEGMRKSMRKS